MPPADLPPNGKNPPDSIPFERSSVECPRCKHVFRGLIFESIDGLEQLRLSDGLIELLKLRCLHCGEIFNWSPTEKTLKQWANDYHELLLSINHYIPE